MGAKMDLSVVILILVMAAPILWIPFVGKKWAVILSNVIYGTMLGVSLLVAYSLLSEPPAGPSVQFGLFDLTVAAFAAAMMLVTYFVYRYRKFRSR